MRYGLLLLLLLLLLSLPTRSQAQCPGVDTVLEPLAEEVIPVGSSSVPLTSSVYQQLQGTAVLAVVQVQGAAVVYRQAGVPSPSSGVVMGIQGNIAICGLPSIQAFRVTRFATTDAALFVTYYRLKSP